MLAQYIAYFVFYEVAFSIAFSPLIFLIGFLLKIDVQRGSLLAIVIFTPALLLCGIYLFFLPFLAHQIARRKVYENMNFHAGLKDVLSEWRVKLAFFHFFGNWLKYKKKDKDAS